MDRGVPLRRPSSRGGRSIAVADDDAALPLRGGVWPPSRRLNDTKTMLASPGPLESMLKTTTETGDIGIFSMRPSRSTSRMRTPYHPTMGPSRGLPSRTMSMDAVGRRRLRDDRRGLPSYRDTTSEIISLYGPNRDNSGRGSSARSLDAAGPRSYSLTSCSSRLLSDQKSTGTSESRSSGGDRGVLARPRSPYPYHTRLKRPGVRPISPALTSDGIVDYSRMVEIDRPSYRTIHRSYSRAYRPDVHRVPQPRSQVGDGRSFQYLSSGDGGDNALRSGYALPELPPAWVNHNRNRSVNAAMERGDETSSITSVVRLYGHSRASSVTRHPPVSRLGPFYYDYSEDFEPADGRHITACVTVSPTPTRSSTMNRPRVLDDGCEPLLAGRTDMDTPVLPPLHGDLVSNAPSPSRTILDPSVPRATLDCAPLLTKEPCEGSPALDPVALVQNAVTLDPISSNMVYQDLVISNAITPEPILKTSTAQNIVNEPSNGQISLAKPMNRSQVEQEDGVLPRARLQPDAESSWATIPSERDGRSTVTQADRHESVAKCLTGVLEAEEPSPSIKSTANDICPSIVATVNSHNLLDTSFCSTVDTESETRHSDPAMTPAASESTQGQYVADSGEYSDEASEAPTPLAKRQSDMYSLQSGLSDLKSFVHNLDNAGLLRDGDDSTSLDKDIRSSLGGKLDEAMSVHARLRTANKGLESDDLDTYISRHSRLAVTDLTFDSRHSVDGSSLIFSPGKSEAFPPLPGMAYPNSNPSSKLTSIANPRIPTRLSSFHVSPGVDRHIDTGRKGSTLPEARKLGMWTPRTMQNTLTQEGPKGTSNPPQDTSITYGTSGFCAGMQPFRRTPSTAMPVTPPVSGCDPEQLLGSTAAPGHTRNHSRNATGFNGRFKSNIVRPRPTAHHRLAAMTLSRRASGDAMFEAEILVSDKPLPPPPVNGHGGLVTQPRGLKKSLSNLKMRLTDARTHSGDTSSPDPRLPRHDENIGLGVPVTRNGTSSNTFASDSTDEEVIHRGFREKLGKWMKSAKKAVHSCRRVSSSTGDTSLDTDF